MVVLGSAICVVVGQVLAGGVGNYMWHPVALGRILTQILFHREVTPEGWPILGLGRSFWDNLWPLQPLPPLWRAAASGLPDGLGAWSVVRPVDHLRNVLPAGPSGSGAEAVAILVRDTMPPWTDTLSGAIGGAIGETCVLAIMVAGLLLIWRGLLRWRMMLGAVAAAGVLAAVLPVHILSEGGAVASYWLPGVATWQGLPVGLVYVCYHLTAGEFPLVVLLLAPDPSSSPLTLRGHLVFGLIIGAVTMLVRVGVGIPASAYWALLAANTLVPVVNCWTRRQVLGT